MSSSIHSAFAQPNLFQKIVNNPSDSSDLQVNSGVEKASGFLKIAHRDLEAILKLTQTRAELLVLLCLYRFTRGFNRKKCRASHGFISQWSGVSKSSVKRAMQELHGQGVVKKEVVGKATLLSVDLKLESFETSHGVKKLQCCDDLSNGVKLNPVQNDPGLKMNPKEREIGVTLAPKKEKFLKKKEDLLLSQKDKGVRGEELKAYFFSLSNSWKLGLEKKAFGQLLELYKEPEILKAFKFLKVQGTVGARKPCDLPLCYLGKSIERVLELASEKESNERKESEVLKDRALQKKLEQRKLQDQEKKFQVALRLFTRKFKNDDEQERAIQQALGEKYPRFQPSGKMRKKLGVMAWVEGECGKNFFHIPESKLQSEVEISEIFREFTVVKNSTESGVL